MLKFGFTSFVFILTLGFKYDDATNYSNRELRECSLNLKESSQPKAVCHKMKIHPEILLKAGGG